MIRYIKGSILDTPVDAAVNTVNTVGVMGKGVALVFKRMFPHNYEIYREACKMGLVRTGKMHVTLNVVGTFPLYIINFPTKEHWKNPSKMEWINAGLMDLFYHVIPFRKIKSLAMPALGCGNGGLDWFAVKKAINAYGSPMASKLGVDVIVYEPESINQQPTKTTNDTITATMENQT